MPVPPKHNICISVDDKTDEKFKKLAVELQVTRGELFKRMVKQFIIVNES